MWGNSIGHSRAAARCACVKSVGQDACWMQGVGRWADEEQDGDNTKDSPAQGGSSRLTSTFQPQMKPEPCKTLAKVGVSGNNSPHTTGLRCKCARSGLQGALATSAIRSSGACHTYGMLPCADCAEGLTTLP